MRVAYLAISLCLAMSLAPFAAAAAVQADQCLSCHTDPARLIGAVREMLAATARVPGGSEKGAGEG